LALADEEVLNVLDAAKREGAMVMVHAENDAVVRWLSDRLLAQGKTDIKHHLTAHPSIGDREATHRAISFSELMEVPILITHVSHRDGAEQIRWAQTRGLKIYGAQFHLRRRRCVQLAAATFDLASPAGPRDSGLCLDFSGTVRRLRHAPSYV
jgi:hypothetical protein